MDDPLVEALRALVEREGGWVAVGDAIGHNDQSIYQILKGVLLPSGKPKGVGPNLRKKLDKHYPGWLSLATPGIKDSLTPQPPALSDALPVVLEALGGLTAGQWRMVRARLDDMAGHPEMRDDVAGDVLPLLSAPTSKPQRAA